MKTINKDTQTVMVVETLPIIPTMDVVVFPHMIVPLLVLDERIINGINQALDSSKRIMLLAAKKKIDLSNRPSDHIVVQLSSDRWLNAPDSIDNKRKGSSRGANIYFMLDKPFKSNPKLSSAFGLGFSTSHIFFDKLRANIEGNTPVISFESLDSDPFH